MDIGNNTQVFRVTPLKSHTLKTPYQYATVKLDDLSFYISWELQS